MPQAALRTGSVDFVLPLQVIARALIALVMVRGAAILFQVTRAPRTSPLGQEFPHWGEVTRYGPDKMLEA
jgi:hypothetical protein